MTLISVTTSQGLYRSTILEAIKMSMSVSEAVKGFLLPLVKDAVDLGEKGLVSILPGLPGALLAEALALPWVQAEIAKLEAAGVDEASILAGKGVDALEALVLSHTKGKLHDWLQKEFTKGQSFQLNLTPDDEVLMVKAVEAGKFSEALKLGMKALGL